MRISDLRALVQELNRAVFNAVLPDGADETAVDMASIEVSEDAIAQSQKRCLGRSHEGSCFCGVLKQGPVSAGTYQAKILLNHFGKKRWCSGVAVGFVIDDATQNNNHDLDVVLAIGINYGQGDAYLASGVNLFDKTGMRPKLANVFTTLVSNGECKVHWMPSTESPYHLVVANIFPWITRQSWDSYQLNAIEETLLLACFKSVDIATLIEKFLKRTNRAGLCALVFHGANNGVPYFGTQFIERFNAANSRTFRLESDIIFCDNLAPGYGSKVSNAVHVCRHQVRKPDLIDLDV